jgi:hypothetical protein
MKLYEDLEGNKPFKWLKYIPDENGKSKPGSNVYFGNRLLADEKNFPACFIFLKKTDHTAKGMQNIDKWTPIVQVWFYTLSMDEDDMPLLYHYLEEIDRMCMANRHLTNPVGNANDLCVMKAECTGGSFDFAYKDSFVVDESVIELKVQLQKVAVKL